MSWSEGRSSEREVEPISKRLENLAYVNGALAKLCDDEDLHDELKNKFVRIAIDHWTGKKRLPPEESKKFQDNRSCMYVLQRLQMLQHACKLAGISVPLDHMTERRKKLDFNLVLQYFGSDIMNSKDSPVMLYSDEIQTALKAKEKKFEGNNDLNAGGNKPQAESKKDLKTKSDNSELNSSKPQETSNENNADSDDDDHDHKYEEKIEYSSQIMHTFILILIAVALYFYSKYRTPDIAPPEQTPHINDSL